MSEKLQNISISSQHRSKDEPYNRMEEELTCPVCLELYADPLMLPCSHSLCKKCLEDIIQSRVKSGQEGLDCPSCRKKHQVSKEQLTNLPKNLALENIVFRFQEIQSASLSQFKSNSLSLNSSLGSQSSDRDSPVFAEDVNELCGLCDGKSPNKATWFCEQCSVLYCERCLEKFHPRRGTLCHHWIRKPSHMEGESKPAFCEDHTTEQATVFCDQCKVLVCHLCLCDGLGKHTGHKVLARESACQQVKETVESTKKSLESMSTVVQDQSQKMEDLSEELEDVHRQACQKVENQYRRLLEDTTSALRQQKQALIQSLTSAKSKSVSQLHNHLDVNSKTSKQVEDLLESCKKILDEDHTKGLLSRATEIPPLTEQTQEIEDCLQKSRTHYCELVRSCSIQQDLKRAVTKFRSASMSCLQTMATDEPGKCQSIIPLIKSPSSAGKEAPRVQNKCLTTWGFNSTSFTAESLDSNSLWSVTIEKNSSHVGDTKSGYLFGVGIASDQLGNKELVGMNGKSYGIACSNGNLVYCHNSKIEQLMPLDGLPLSITVCVTNDQSESVILSFTITNSSWGDTLSCKKVLMDFIHGDPIYPVFTVSQRVKMQFPTHV
ncbi:probable E3 ubiquitin-protein ligase MID2 isoform X3 [Mytilus edulis]|uniref:probable E3 ubiquitin-protein ligase MID2 isoform X3 n=1 Tax=Mytilus edulis TaxID=6550 RepID=UPI0039EE16F4